MSGETDKTKNPLTCDYHWLQYRIECERRAEDADSVIHSNHGERPFKLVRGTFYCPAWLPC